MAPTVTPIQLSDAPEALRFLRVSGGHAPECESPPDDWIAWLGRGITLAGVEAPLGWKLTVGGRIVGVHFVTPFRNRDDHGQPFYDLVSHNYYVDVSCRGPRGLALFHRFLSLNKQFRLKATTANAISGALWKYFHGVAVQHSDVEFYEAPLSTSLIAEAFYRTSPRFDFLFARLRSYDRATLSDRLDNVVRSLAGMVTAAGTEATVTAASLAVALPRPSLDVTAPFLEWTLANPWQPHRLLLLRQRGRSTVVVLSGQSRGLRQQIAAISIRSIWTEGGTIDDTVLAAVHRACAQSAHMVNYGCDVSGLSLPSGTKRRVLDGPRRWIIAPPETPTADRWLGLDGI